MNFLTRRFNCYGTVFQCNFFYIAVLLMTLNLCLANPRDVFKEQTKNRQFNRPAIDKFFTVHGDECKHDCVNKGTSYYWCYKKLTPGWDYCSPSHDVTRYGKPCHANCGNEGTSYYYCYDQHGAWDYCSPTNKA